MTDANDVLNSLGKVFGDRLAQPTVESVKQAIINALGELEIEDIQVTDAELTDAGYEVTFVQGDREITAVFSGDQEPEVVVLSSSEEDEENYSEYIDLSDYKPELYDDSKDIVDFSKLTPEIVYFVLTGEELEPEITEASISVIRGGKKVRKKLIRKKRKKPLNAKRKLAIRKAVIKRKRTAKVALRKRMKSLRLRKRANLKKKPSKFRLG